LLIAHSTTAAAWNSRHFSGSVIFGPDRRRWAE
jgi:hypothetical protein